MNLTSSEARQSALRELQAGSYIAKPGDPLAPAFVLLKLDGYPIVTTADGTPKQPLLRHELLETDLSKQEVKQARQRGIGLALRWHRFEHPKDWRSLIEDVACPFEQDAARDYLRDIMTRMRSATVQMGNA